MDTIELADPPHKTCSKCQARKPLTEFNFGKRAANARHSYCRDCGCKFTRSHYRRRKRQDLDRNRRSYAVRRQMVVDAQSCLCADCGIQYPYYVLEFVHRERVSKKFPLHAVHGATKNVILREIAKCDVVGANCHRERTHRREIGTALAQ